MRYDSALGWISGDGGNHIHLRLEQDADHKMFRHDLRKKSAKLTQPKGVNQAMAITDKLITLTPSIGKVLSPSPTY
jgi:hypothetical protein